MTVKDEYLDFRNHNQLKTSLFEDRVRLQKFLRDRLNAIWSERPNFTNGGLLTNYMTRYALGFAYYDCKPTPFCKTKCYGLPISGLHDYYMLRLGVITSESLKTNDTRFMGILLRKVQNLKYLKIGHWGDAVLEQVPNIVKLVMYCSNTKFWWYTRKLEIALEANNYNIKNLRVYLSLDPDAPFPSASEYPYGITYFFGEGEFHPSHSEILNDSRLVAIFPLKKGRTTIDPAQYGMANHPKICLEKKLLSRGFKGNEMCFSCNGRCRY